MLITGIIVGLSIGVPGGFALCALLTMSRLFNDHEEELLAEENAAVGDKGGEQ